MEYSKEYNELKKVVRAILVSLKRKGVAVSVLEEIYREREGKNIPLFGYSDTIGVLNSLTDTVDMKLRQGQMLVFPVNTDKTRHIADMVANQFPSKSRRARGRISRAPRHRDLDVEGSNNFNERKEVEKICVDPDSKQYTSGYYKYTKRLGENSRIETDFWDNESDQNSNYKTYNNSETDDAQKSNDDQMKDDGSFEFEFDYQLMKFEEQHIASDGLPKVQFNELFQINTKFEVYIAQVHSPYKFWFQLKEDSEKLFTLMSAMDYYYNTEDEKIAKDPIPNTHLKLGSICVALYQSEWHRAEIVDIFEFSVMVFYLDYGTVDEVHKKDVRFLNKRFSKQPAYAHRGCLDRCKPNDGIWTVTAMEAFQDRFISKDLPVLVRVTNVNIEEKTVYFDIFDRSGKMDVSISDWLIENNFAYPTNKLLYDFQKRHYNEVYPSFENLENSKYPSFKIIKEMLSNNFNYLEYEDSIIIPEMYGYETIE